MTPLLLFSYIAFLVACIPALSFGKSAARSTFTLTSSNFANGGSFSAGQIGTDARCGSRGKARSPELTWSGSPKATQSYAVVVFDVDARKESGFVHWVDYGIPASVTQLREGAATPRTSPYVAGLNDAGSIGYFGLCPPPGDPMHRYHITLYALDLPPEALAVGQTREQLLAALRKHILAMSSIVGLYRGK